MGKKIIQVPADEEFIDKVDEIRNGKPRAQIMREAFLFFYSRGKERELDEVYLEGYRKKPEDYVLAEAQAEMLGEVFSGEDW